MIGSVPPAFMQAELDYRIQRIKDSYQPRVRSGVRRPRRRPLLSWRRRPVPNPAALSAPTLPLGAPYKLVGRS
ncbi:MAG TPA: hypothetical protein VG899_08485 [Mycobacteriales bacterium]|nr:hypothetical protein [Mycobacteriales bacterium]HWA66390.1 hypothetical protein [Mycobacteriales bacterium]